MATTSQLRTMWAPPCEGPWSTVALYGEGRVTVRSSIVPAVLALDECLRAHAYTTRRADTGAYNCLAGETEIITRDGVRAIGDLAGQSVQVLTRRGSAGNAVGGPGRWVETDVRSYGPQPLWRIVLGSSGREKVLHATAGHRWYVRTGEDQKFIAEATTEQLRPAVGRTGHRLLSLYPQSVASRTIPSPVGISAGLVFGDGSLNKYGGVIALYGAKNFELARFFSAEQAQRTYHDAHHAEPHLLITGLPRSWKRPPSLDEGPAHLYGWLAGYFAADGRVTKAGTVELNSCRAEDLETARAVALRLGIATRPISSSKREVPLPNGGGTVVSTIYGMRFTNRSLDSSFFLIPAHRSRFNQARQDKRPAAWRVLAVEPTDRVETVYCVEVPGTECFTLDDFILTGNCRRITGGTGWSLHAYGIALDINWQSNPYGRALVTDMPPEMVDAIKAIRTAGGVRVWGWGGDYSGNKDAMHYEIVCSPVDIASGIDPATVPGGEDMTAEQDARLRQVETDVRYVGTEQAKMMTDVRYVGSMLAKVMEAQGIPLPPPD